ncbi:MAG: hypothetical protein MI757_00155 [Pirellulales bacterium]|nr:hypothetical protein [Pirellulales bacterium]
MMLSRAFATMLPANVQWLVLLGLAAVIGCASQDTIDSVEAGQFDLNAEEPREAESEVPVGAFMVSVPVQLPEHDAWYRVTFDLALGVAEADEPYAADFVAEHEQRLRHEVASVLRQAEIDNLESAKLGELRTRLVDTINRFAGNPVVNAAYLANFSAEVQ